MSLIKCPECGREISSRVSKCPGCGLSKEEIEDTVTEQKRIEISSYPTISFICTEDKKKTINGNVKQSVGNKTTCPTCGMGYDKKISLTCPLCELRNKNLQLEEKINNLLVKYTQYLNTNNIVENNNIGVGSTIEFGTFAGVSIDWIVLAKENDRTLLLSKNVLDIMPYNSDRISMTWETCELRKYLNGEFYKNCFSDVEKGRVQSSIVKNNNNKLYSTSGGNETNDKVFCLSIEEVDTYLKDNDYIKAVVTRRVDEKLGRLRIKCLGWWLRSPGCDNTFAALVTEDGSKSTAGIRLDSDQIGVRPALWLRTS